MVVKQVHWSMHMYQGTPNRSERMNGQCLKTNSLFKLSDGKQLTESGYFQCYVYLELGTYG